MFTWGPKYLLGISVAAWVAALFYGLVTGGGIVGVLSFGYKGGVGDHLGYAILMGVAFATAFLAGVLFATRDGEADTLARVAGTERVPQVTPPSAPSYWGALTAFGLACLMLGVALSPIFLYLGIAVLGVVAIEWMALAWSDRATGDPDTNRAVKDRVLGPIEIPMLGSLAIAVVAIGFSRVFLAAGKIGAVVAGSIVAVLIFGAATAMAQSNAPRRIISAAVATLGVLVIGGGVVGAIIGPAPLEHGDEHGDQHGEPNEDHSTDDEEGSIVVGTVGVDDGEVLGS